MDAANAWLVIGSAWGVALLGVLEPRIERLFRRRFAPRSQSKTPGRTD